MAEPKVRFKKANGESYPEWVEYTVADVFDKVKDKNKNLENTNVITNSAEFGLVNQREFFDKDIAVEGKTNNYTIIKNGDFVYNPRKSSYAPMGPFNCYGLEDDGIVSPLYTCLRPKGVLDSNFLLWYFKTDKWHGYVNEHGAQNGARHDRVGMTDAIMMGIPITAPCDEEQQKIANALEQVDSLISKAEQEVEKLQELKRGCLQKMFPRDGASVPEVRFTEFTGDWEQRKLGECCDIYLGLTYTPEYVDDGVMFISSKDISSDYLDLTNPKYISREEFEASSSNAKPKRGDILFTRVGSNLGHPVVVETDEELCIFVSLGYLRMKSSCDNYFTKHWMNSSDFEHQLYQKTAGGAKVNVNTGWLKKFDFKYPIDIEEQKMIGDFFSSLDNLITLHQRECEKYKELKKGLLQQMFV